MWPTITIVFTSSSNAGALRSGGTVENLVGTSIYGGHNLPPSPVWNRLKVAAKRRFGRIPTVPLRSTGPGLLCSAA